jgi:hypothetical protein
LSKSGRELKKLLGKQGLDDSDGGDDDEEEDEDVRSCSIVGMCQLVQEYYVFCLECFTFIIL